MLPLRFYPSLFVAALTVAIPVSLLRSQTAPSNQVLQTITLDAGQQQTVKWTNISNANQYSWDAFVDYIGWEPDNPLEHEYYYGLTRDDTDPLAPDWDTTGAARYSSRIQAIGGAWSAGAGFYNYSADFGVQAVVSTTDLAIKTVVLQVVEMRHPSYSMEEHLIHKHTNWWNEDDDYGGDEEDNPTDEYGYVPALAALDDLLDGYFGGPLLLCTTAENPSTTTVLAPVAWDIIGGPVHLQVGGFQGNYYSFAYQWDLSVVEGTVTGIEVIQPVIHSASTIGVQLDLGDTWQQVIHTLPAPPADLVATPGNTTATLTWADGAPAHAAYAPASAYSVKRAASAEGPWTEIATGITTTTFTDTGLVNGTEYHYIVTAMATGDKTADSASVSVVPAATLSLLEDWRQTHFGTTVNEGDAADTADPEGDGLSNLFEYALGLDPLLSDSTEAVTIGKSTDGQRLTLTFNRIADPDLTYTVEATSDLSAGTWETVFTSTGEENVAGSYTAEDAELIADHTRRFLRLTVTATTDTVKDAPRGFQAMNLPAGTSSLGLPLLNEAVYAATVDAVSDHTLTLGGASGSNIGALLAPESDYPFYLEVISGPLEGERLDINVVATIAAGNKTVVLSSDYTRNTLPADRFAELAGNAVAVRRHITLTQIQGLFEGGLTGHAVSFLADAIQVFEATGFRQYSLNANGSTWTTAGIGGDQRYLPIPPGVGILVKLTQAKTLFQEGSVRANVFRFNLKVGSQFVALPWPLHRSPNQIGAFVDSSQETSLRWTGHAVSFLADAIQIFTQAGFVQYTLSSNGSSWIKSGDPYNYADSPLLQGDQAFIIKRQKANSDYLILLPY
ncbi:fibronectin [Opitutaceae bacterium TAV5]|nr:fibronectin [Opitutaceae bacterium TAV5]